MKNTISNDIEALPILKWPGGKRWLSSTLKEIIACELNGTYYEPFLGGAATFLAVQPKYGVLSDLNNELVQFYQTCIKFPDKVIARARSFPNNRESYYKVRRSRPRSIIGKAGRFFYLNRTCWGGIYRLNRRGEFNVPFGDLRRPLCTKEHVVQSINVMKSAKIECCDFQRSFNNCKKGDVIFADPPYTSKGQFNGFVRYNEKLFSWADQVRLQKSFKKAKSKGAFVIVCGSFHKDIVALYENCWVLEVRRHSLVAKKGKGLTPVSECLIFSRKPNKNLEGLTRITQRFISDFRHFD